MVVVGGQQVLWVVVAMDDEALVGVIDDGG